MKTGYKASLIAAALASTMATPVAAQNVTISAEELAQMRTQLQAMDARISQLESELDQAEAQIAQNAATPVPVAPPAAPAQPATEVNWKGAPELKHDDGWSFKPRGRLQYDAGVINAPASTGRDEGFSNDIRRARLGVSGDMPGGFGYKFEVDVANSDVAVTDAIISYETGDVEVSVGQFNNFQSLEELTSSLHTSFIERAAFTDAFNFVRRVGVAVEYAPGDVLIQGGVFSDNMDRLQNNSWSADGRIVYMPKIGDTQLHLGGSVHHRGYETGTTARYRQRPLVSFTSTRFINTGNLPADSETSFGLEGAFISGRLHGAVEGYWRNLNMPAGIGMNDPTFFGGYAEVGFYLTDDTRGYKGGKFDRTKPNSPVGEGGMGSFQVNLRYDRLDLNDAGVIGGTQNGYFLSLVWKPTDYTMLLANYGILDYSDAIFPTATGDTSYNVDVLGVRAQIDF